MTAQADDERFMRLALTLGRRGLGNAWPNPAVGAVIVKDGAILGRGWTQPGGRPHAETMALTQAGEAAHGAILYVTLEPCSHHGKTPPCADAVVAAGVGRVVSAMEDPNPEVAGQGHAKLRAARISVESGLMEAEARHAHAGHIRRVTDGRPHVTLKLAVSADGKAGLADRKPVAITGEVANTRAHLLRSMNDAILVGVGTVLSDDPLLTCRLPGMAARSPVRVVLDASLRTPLASNLAKTAAETLVWLMAAKESDKPAADLESVGVEIIRVPAASGRIDLHAALKALAGRGITRLLVEGGPTVAAAFLQADLVDEAVLLRSATPIGNHGIDAIEGQSLDALTRSPRLKSCGVETLGTDTMESFIRA